MNTPNFSGLVYTIKSGSVKLALWAQTRDIFQKLLYRMIVNTTYYLHILVILHDLCTLIVMSLYTTNDNQYNNNNNVDVVWLYTIITNYIWSDSENIFAITGLLQPYYIIINGQILFPFTLLQIQKCENLLMYKFVVNR
jgi:hypothetical protein